MKVLITGADGQLGYDFQRFFDSISVDYLAANRAILDVTDFEAVDAFFDQKRFTHIINCAAYNNVDKAESDTAKCFSLNATAPEYLAKKAEEMGAVFITYSTDFVFDGEKKSPYTEEDVPNPLSVYGKSKLKGEQLVAAACAKVFVIRTSWVFGVANNNFNKQVIGWSKTRDKLSIVDDQVSSPTYSKDLAEYSWQLIKSCEYGLYHISNNEEASKYDQAKFVLNQIGWGGQLGTAKTSDFDLPAERANYSYLSSRKVESLIGVSLPNWKLAIENFLKEMDIS